MATTKLPKINNTYSVILKTISIFGGTQVYGIFISIIRIKVIAVLLGPSGVGLIGLYNAAISLISGFTNFGIDISGARKIALIANSKNDENLHKTITTVKIAFWLTGLLGFVIMVIFAPYISKSLFNNNTATIPIMWSGLVLFFNSLLTSNLMVLQGLQKTKQYAKANLIGNTIGLIITLPLYYFYNIDAIVPSLILTSLISFLITTYFVKGINIKKQAISIKEIAFEGKDLLKLGAVMSISGLFSTITAYFLKLFINNYGGIEQIGLYNAGFTLLNTYVGLIFTSMSLDYLPRLSAKANNNIFCKKSVNRQAELLLIIIGPILIFFIFFTEEIIQLFYSNSFIEASKMVSWAILGIYFKVMSWSISYVFVAKGASKIFFWSELVASIYTFTFNILGYYFYGLTGLGISFLLSYAVYFVHIYILARINYLLFLRIEVIKIFSVQFGLIVTVFLLSNYVYHSIIYYLFGALFFISIGYSLVELNKRINLKSSISFLFQRS